MKHVYMLFAAIALEVTGTTFMKFSVTHEWLIGYPVMLAAMACSYFCLSKAVKKIPNQRRLRRLGRAWPCGHGFNGLADF